MASRCLLFLAVLYLAGVAEIAIASASKSYSNPSDFIKVSCRATRYPDLCVQCLSSYASIIRQNEHRLALTALTVSINRARSAADFVSKMTKARGIGRREHQAVQDCIENLGDSVERLSQSVKELGGLGRRVGQDFVWHMSNVQTWVSAALTDENTCVDGFAGRAIDGNVKLAIRRRVASVARVTSNALALVNRFASRHAPKYSTAESEKP